MKHYEEGNRIPVRSQQVWNILAAQATLKPIREKYEADGGWSGWGKGLITYGDLAELMGMNRKAGFTLGKHVGIVAYYCKENGLPPLNSIVVNDQSGEPGHAVVETDGFQIDQIKVLDGMNWFSIRPPSIRALREVYEKYILNK